jgi:pyruvate/2-oxoglutarate dehydrogenase complex dihydrolipoamide dehydrogenase (E3) component
MTMTVLTPDLCVLGAGSGGLVVASGAVQMGASVVLLEPHKMGGDCLNYGCVPSKALLSAAASHPRPSYGEAMKRVQAAIAVIEPNDSVERFEGLGVHVIQQAGRFIDKRTVEAADGTLIRARRFVIATGSHAMIPPIPGLDQVPYVTNETLWDLREAPAHLLVIGGGPIGCEMALAHRRLGSAVTILERSTMLPRDEPELVDVVRHSLIAEGIDIREGVGADSVETSPEGVRLTLSDGTTVSGSHLLVAAGRGATVDGLGLEAAEILLERGAIRTDAGMRTTNPKVFAAGDVAGGPQFTHAAGYQAGIVLKRALFHLPAKADHGLIPWATYTDPELSHVGLTEADARQKHGDIVRVLTWKMDENDRAIATGRTEGMVKAIVTKHGRILGASIVGPHAGELILPWCLAIQNKLKISAMAQVIAPYPTLSEASKRAAGSFYSESLFSTRTRRIVGWLQKLP